MVQVIAHRGLRNEMPENTSLAISAAIQLPGIHGVEFDVELAADGRSVVLHQETLVPSADYKRVELATRDFSSRDWVRETDSTALVRMDAGSWMSDDFSDMTIPTLRDILNLSWGHVVAYVELKDATYWGKRDPLRAQQVVEAALPDLQAYSGSINVISFNPDILLNVRKAMGTTPTTLALWTEWRTRIREAVAKATYCGASAISLPDVLVLEQPEWVRIAHDSNLKVHVYPVSPARDEEAFLSWTAASQVDRWRRLKKRGVDAILSDFARESLAELNGAVEDPD